MDEPGDHSPERAGRSGKVWAGSSVRWQRARFNSARASSCWSASPIDMSSRWLLSGQARDAFPSGHAVHMGALASAAGLLPKTPRRLLRTVAIALSLTRIAVLAHWASDVVAGFALGAAVERLLRPWTLTQSFRKQINWRKRP